MSVCKGRFDYIKRGIVGVCAATLLTGIVAAPAFATDFTDGTMTSTVTANTAAIGQISVTVPTTALAGVSDAAGTFTFADNYAFTNNSPLSVSISKVKVTPKSSVNLVASDAADPGDNAINIKATVGTAEVDLAKYVTETSVTGAPAIAKGTHGTIDFTGTIANATKAGVSENLPVADIVWTLTTA